MNKDTDALDKTRITLLERKELDNDPFLEDMLIEDEKNKIHYHTILWSTTLLILVVLAW